MYDLERIELIISDIEKYLEKIKSMNIKFEKDLKDDLKFYASSMLIFSTLNRLLDLCEEIVKTKKLGTPLEYKDYFEMLERAKIISEKRRKNMEWLIIIRNRLSHRYGKVNEKDIFDWIKDLKEVEDFVKDIQEEVKKNEK